MSSTAKTNLAPGSDVFQLLYSSFERLTDSIISPKPPGRTSILGSPKVAVIGAGITGVTAAAHCVGHGFDVHIFEAGGVESLGGIWSRVNETSALQIHSVMYRFHPKVKWNDGYPNKREILEQITKIWKAYGLESRTSFNTYVNRIYQDKSGRWIINDPSNGRFEGLIAAIGTCAAPKTPHIPGLDKFKGEIHHSSELTGKTAAGKELAIIGGGASAVEALEFSAKENAEKIYVLSRSDKWIIPRNAIVNVALSLNVWGQETAFSWIPETLLRKLFYRDLQNIAPSDKGLFTDTPMVNSDILDKLRSGQAEWVRCDIEELAEGGVVVKRRGKGVPAGGPGRHQLIGVDMVVMATGFSRPHLSFLPDDCFEEPYPPPNWYLQTFPPSHPSISAINCTYLSAIGTVGNWHIGIYTRILLMFLVDPLTRPSAFWMRKWIDMTRFLKRTSPTAAFDFFTYLELLWWFLFCIAINPFRWKWAPFVFLSIGLPLPAKITEVERRVVESTGHERSGAEDGRDVGSSL